MKNEKKVLIDTKFVKRYSEGEQEEPIFEKYYNDPNYEIVHKDFDGVYDTYELWEKEKKDKKPPRRRGRGGGFFPPWRFPRRKKRNGESLDPYDDDFEDDDDLIDDKGIKGEDYPTRDPDDDLDEPEKDPDTGKDKKGKKKPTDDPDEPDNDQDDDLTDDNGKKGNKDPKGDPDEPDDDLDDNNNKKGKKEPTDDPDEPDKNPDDELTDDDIKEQLPKEVYVAYLRVRKKYKSLLPAEALALALVTLFTSGINISEEYKRIFETRESVKPTIEAVDTLREEVEGRQYILGPDVNIGGEYDLETGNAYFYGNYTGSDVLIKEGNYKVTGFCINDKNGKYIASLEDQDLNGLVDHYYKDGRIDRSSSDEMISNFTKFIEKVCTEKGLRYDEINISIQVARIGWVDITDALSYNIVDPQTIETSTTTTVFDEEIDDFKGDTITFDVNGNNVTVNLKDENGDFLKPGSKVIGSDGREYTIDGLDVVNITEEHTESLGKHISLRLSIPGLGISLALLGAAVIAEIHKQRKNKRFQENPQIRAFPDRTSYQMFLKQFRKNLEQYHKKSGLFKKIQRFFVGETIEVAQDLTDEDVKKIYDVITHMNNAVYCYSPKDQIEFKNGQIIIHLKDGYVLNITDEVIPLIKDIGKDNPEIEEGLLDETYEQYTGEKPDHGEDNDSSRRI